MSFSIHTYDPRYLQEITALYNAETAFEPYIAPLDPGRFVALVAEKSSFDPAGLFVAIEGGQVVGWVHACAAPGSEGHHDPADRAPRIRMLIFSRDRIKVGCALVSEATGWLRSRSEREIEALHAKAGYPFYRGLWLGGELGSATMPHVQLALDVAGYKSTQESIFMTAEIHGLPDEVAAAVPLEFVEGPAEVRHSRCASPGSGSPRCGPGPSWTAKRWAASAGCCCRTWLTASARPA
jgi:hypothetical protein